VTSILEQATELTGDGHGHHIPGTPMVYKHGWKPTSEQTDASAVPWDKHGTTVTYRGSLGIDRGSMPQLSGVIGGKYQTASKVVPEFLSQLQARGVSVSHERIPSGALRPTQTTGDIRVIRSIADDLKSGKLAETKPIIVSSDNRVLDGHHTWAGRWLAETEGGRPGLNQEMPVIKIGLPIRQLLSEAEAFDKAKGISHLKTGQTANPARAHLLSEGPLESYSLRQHTHDGRLDPERQALHDKIVADALQGMTPVDHPVATFLGGGPASGKSSVMGHGIKNTVMIAADDIKALFPEYKEGLKNGQKDIAVRVHEESTLVARKIQAEAEKRHLNYLLDGTGDNSFDKMAGKVRKARASGHIVSAKYVTTSVEEALRRSEARARATGRMMPATVLRETHKSVSEIFPKLISQGLVDSAELWDNNGATPKLVGSKPLGGAWSVHDPVAWQQFLDKAKTP
jgi:predicted ABC-type ATPase